MRTLLDVIVASRTGTAIVTHPGDVVDFNTIDNSIPRVALRVENTDASPQSIEFQTPFTRDGLALAERTIALAAGAKLFIGPFDNPTYGQPDEDNGITRAVGLFFQVSDPAVEVEVYRIN